MEIQVMVWSRHKHVAGLNRLMDSKSSVFEQCCFNHCLSFSV